MTPKIQMIIAGVLAVVCIGGVIGLATNKGSVREYLDKNYTRAAAGSVPGATSDTITYTSATAPSATAAKIAKAWKPADRQDQPAGTFLRYDENVVGVTPAPNGGSFISYDNDRDGYARWFPYVVGFWGPSFGTGAGDGFRSGGPGVGK